MNVIMGIMYRLGFIQTQLFENWMFLSSDTQDWKGVFFGVWSALKFTPHHCQPRE
jgi:hypothetical protein